MKAPTAKDRKRVAALIARTGECGLTAAAEQAIRDAEAIHTRDKAL